MSFFYKWIIIKQKQLIWFLIIIRSLKYKVYFTPIVRLLKCTSLDFIFNYTILIIVAFSEDRSRSLLEFYGLRNGIV